MYWLGFAILSVFAFSVAALFQRLAMKEEASDPITSTITFQLLLVCFSAVPAVIMGFHLPPLFLLPHFLASAALYAFGTLFFFKAIKIIEASEMSIIAGAGTLVTIIASFFFLSERLTPIQWTGAFLILAAVGIVQHDHRALRFNKGVLYALLGTSFYGLAVVFDGFILRSFDTFSFIPIMSLLPATVLMITYPKKLPKLAHDIQKINKNLGMFGLLYVIGAETFYFPLKNGALVSQMSSISRASIIATVLLAMIFLNERSHPWKKLAGAILTTIGVMLIR